jgi:hypothetical protein
MTLLHGSCSYRHNILYKCIELYHVIECHSVDTGLPSLKGGFCLRVSEWNLILVQM